MSLAITDEQNALRATARSFLASASPLTRVREVMATAVPFDEELWRRSCTELGAIGLAVPDELGGAGLGYLEVSYLAEEAGRALSLGPLVSTVGLAIPALMAGLPEVGAVWLPRLCDGSAVAALAWLSTGEPWTSTTVSAHAVKSDLGWRVSGSFSPVLDGAAASVLFVLAHTTCGPTMFVIESEAQGVSRTPLPALDQTRGLARIDLFEAPATLLSAEGDGAAILATALYHADIVLAAEMVGGAQACLDMSVAYAKVREQFGRPIGSFQAIKHKCAEVMVEVEGARAMARYASWCASHLPQELPLAAAVAKATAAEAYLRAAGENLQIHGGIGVTWEHDAHLYFKRAKASLMLFGDVGTYRRRVADLIGI